MAQPQRLAEGVVSIGTEAQPSLCMEWPSSGTICALSYPSQAHAFWDLAGGMPCQERDGRSPALDTTSSGGLSLAVFLFLTGSSLTSQHQHVQLIAVFQLPLVPDRLSSHELEDDA